MRSAAIEAEGLGKRYRLGGGERYLALRDKITEVFARPFGSSRPLSAKDRWFWALEDVSFSIEHGEAVGIIGRNGAGKSTLLKILTQITRPTRGVAHLSGRVGSLLEVGTGFHPELTGRENVYFNGGILGMKKKDIDARFDEIVAFAETERFIDTVVKRYSTGMQVRLAFSVAAHLEPDVLLVDEVLAVGDLNFQRKCLSRLADVAGSGRTVLFVSHQMNQIRRLCQRAIWLDEGRIVMVGPAHEVISAYEAEATSPSVPAPSDGARTRIVAWHLEQDGQEGIHSVRSWGPLKVSFSLVLANPLEGGHAGVALSDAEGALMWGTSADDISLQPGRHEFSFSLPYLPLRPGRYHWKVSLWKGDRLLDLWDAVPELLIATEPVTHMSDEWTGILNIPCDFDIR